MGCGKYRKEAFFFAMQHAVEHAPKSCFNFMFVYSLLPQFVTILGLESRDMFSRLLQDIEKPTWLFFCTHISKMVLIATVIGYRIFFVHDLGK